MSVRSRSHRWTIITKGSVQNYKHQPSNAYGSGRRSVSPNTVRKITICFHWLNDWLRFFSSNLLSDEFSILVLFNAIKFIDLRTQTGNVWVRSVLLGRRLVPLSGLWHGCNFLWNLQMNTRYYYCLLSQETGRKTQTVCNIAVS